MDFKIVPKVNGTNVSLAGHTHNMSEIPNGNLETTRLVEPSYYIGSVSKTARPIFDVLRGDRTAFLPATQIIIEKSIDGGVTWEDAGFSDTIKRQLFTGQRPSVTIPLKNGVKSTQCMMRITITGMKYNVPAGTPEINKYDYWGSSYIQSTERYFSLSDGWAWVSGNSDRIHLKVERATGLNPTAWQLDREAFLVGWSGGNYFSLSGNTFGGGTTQTSNFWNWRFTFRTCSNANTFNDADLSASYTTATQAIHHLKLSGMNAWTLPNSYMNNEHLYSWDENQNANFPAKVKGTQITSTIADGTPPREVTSKTPIPNLNAESAQQIKNQNGSVYIKVWKGTQTEYNAIVTKDANTLYFIVGA